MFCVKTFSRKRKRFFTKWNSFSNRITYIMDHRNMVNKFERDEPRFHLINYRGMQNIRVDDSEINVLSYTFEIITSCQLWHRPIEL